jgi:S1-C subfamily serine protease
MSTGSMPIATKWLLSSVGSANQPAINAAYLVASSKTDRKGSAFAVRAGDYLITNEHVVRGSAPADLLVVSASGQVCKATSMVISVQLDLAAIRLAISPADGLRIQVAGPEVGERVHTWGYPLAWNGPSPLLSVGYLAGFAPYQANATSPMVKHYVVNGAFNPGNSGGPLIASVDDAVIGVVVSKHAPITGWHLSALEALKNQKSGLQYTATDASGNTVAFSEGQLVGDLLQYFRDMTQVVIGEAIASEELVSFLDSNSLPWTKA